MYDIYICCTYYKFMTCSYVHVWKAFKEYTNIFTCMVLSLDLIAYMLLLAYVDIKKEPTTSGHMMLLICW